MRLPNGKKFKKVLDNYLKLVYNLPVNKKDNNMETPIQLINAARALAGRKAIRLTYGTPKFFVIQSLYHNIRRNALCRLMPEFAIKTKDCERPLDMLRDLGDGRYVADEEFVWEWSDDFKMKMVELLSKVM